MKVKTTLKNKKLCVKVKGSDKNMDVHTFEAAISLTKGMPMFTGMGECREYLFDY